MQCLWYVQLTSLIYFLNALQPIHVGRGSQVTVRHEQPAPGNIYLLKIPECSPFQACFQFPPNNGAALSFFFIKLNESEHVTLLISLQILMHLTHVEGVLALFVVQAPASDCTLLCFDNISSGENLNTISYGFNYRRVVSTNARY